jgi:curli biogenesis system outer membrane secretion channel CsgG
LVADELLYLPVLATVAASNRLLAAKESADVSAVSAKAEPVEPTSKSARPAVVAVFDIEDPGASKDDKVTLQLTEYLTAKLMEVGLFRVVPRDELRARLADQKAASTRACFDTSCQIEIGKALAAQKTVSTKILRVGAQCVVTTTIFDLRSEIAEAGASTKAACGDVDLMLAVEQIVDRLSGRPLAMTTN